MQTNRKLGMITVDEASSKLYFSGRIDRKIAIQFAQDPDNMALRLWHCMVLWVKDRCRVLAVFTYIFELHYIFFFLFQVFHFLAIRFIQKTIP